MEINFYLRGVKALFTHNVDYKKNDSSIIIPHYVNIGCESGVTFLKLSYWRSLFYSIFTGKKNPMDAIEKYKELNDISCKFLHSIDCKIKECEFKQSEVSKNEYIRFKFIGYEFIVRSTIEVFKKKIKLELFEIVPNRELLNGEEKLIHIPDLDVLFTPDTFYELLARFTGNARGYSNEQNLEFAIKYKDLLYEHLEINKSK